MLKNKKYYAGYVSLIGIIFLFSACASQMGADKSRVSRTTIQHESRETGEIERSNTRGLHEGENDYAKDSALKLHSSSGGEAQIAKTQEVQDMMERVLELLEDADSYWDNGDVENTISTLDRAYALLLEADGNAEVPRQKDDLRLLISKRILAVYSAQQSITRGSASQIPLMMNKDIEREIRAFQGPERDFFISSYKRSGIYRDVIMRELKMAGMPEELFWLPLVESGFKVNALSRARALGLWQFIPSTGYKFGLSRNEWIDERMDPVKSTKAAVAYLTELHSMFGDWLTVLAAYNCGEGRVMRIISRQRINYFDRFWDLYNLLPRETSRYVPRFLATLHIINDPKKYGFDLPDTTESSFAFKTVKVDRIMKLGDIADKLSISEEIMNVLNAELRHKITPDREYDLKIPADSLDAFKLAVSEIPTSEKPKLAQRTAFVRHRIRSGETLSSIARRYGVSVSAIRAQNNLRPNTVIIAGRYLTIPTGRPQSQARKGTQNMRLSSTGHYRVQRGDALQIIARHFGVSVAQIKELNNLQSDVIYAGQLLKITSSSQDASFTQAAQKTKIAGKVLSQEDVDALGTNKYIVTKGDSLYRIALKNNMEVQKLKEINNLSDDKIKPGQILIIE